MDFTGGCIRVLLLATLALAPALASAAPAKPSHHKAPEAAGKAPGQPVRQDGRFVLRYRVVNKRKYLSLKAISEYYKLRYRVDAKKKTASFISTKPPFAEVASFQADSRNFTLNGTAAGLSYAVRLHKGEYLLELTDFQDFLDPIMRPSSIPKRRIRTIMLDAGHGGTDNGAQAGGKKEKDLNLLMVKRVGAILTARGFKVLYTRTADQTLTLEARSKAAEKQKPDLFISIHCNAIAPENAATTSGIEVYVANSCGVPSYGGNVLGQDRPGAKFQATNSYWAYLMQRCLVGATKAVDRGVKRKQFYVVSHTPVPAMLIELGFMTYPAELKNLTTAAYQDKLAVAICDGVGQIEAALRPPNTPAPVPLAPPKKPAAK